MRGWRGFSLIELMIAITLSLIVTLGVIAVFIGSRSAFLSTSGTAQLTDGGRFALNFIADSVRGAGYMACTTAANTQSTLSAGATPLPFTFTEALGGFEAKSTGVGTAYTVATPPVTGDGSTADWASGLDAALAGLPVKNSDVLVVRSTLANAQSVYVSTIVDGASSFTVNVPGPLVKNQLAVISDCSKGMVFQITGVGSGSNATVSHSGGSGPGNTTSAFTPLSFAAGSQVTPVDTVVYYIGKGADGDGALFSYDLNATGSFAPNELVPDIEAMQVLYGVDTSQTQTVSEYVTADNVPLNASLVTEFNWVMSVKVALLAASAPGSAHTGVANTYNLLGTTVTAPIDTRARQVFEETIAVRNSLH